jgi:hypothetical protein
MVKETGSVMRGFIETTIYAPKEQPGYASWVSLFSVPGRKKDHMLSFMEIHRGENKLYRPTPLDFYQSMGIPIKYQASIANGSRDLVTDMVIMRSSDNGGSWNEVGRGAGQECVSNPFSNICLENGDLLRGVGTAYMCMYPEEIPELKIQRSSDNGNTWTDHSIVHKDIRFYQTPYRLKQLKDGILVLLVACWPSFGKDRVLKTRHSVEPNVIERDNTLIYLSKDNGKTWDPPISVLQGMRAPEPDFAELDSGDILIVNSTIQGGPAVRQYIYRTHNGIITGPVLGIVSGEVPETFVAVKDNILVGARRCGDYSCSGDEGETWHKITGGTKCGYQPMIKELDDGRFMCVWHQGGDDQFGEKNQFIGKHVFRVAYDFPKKTKMTIDRNMNTQKTQYINSFTAVLTSGGRTLKGKTVKFAVAERWTPAYENAADPKIAGKIFEAKTNKNGEAVLWLKEYDRTRDIHLSYRITAFFIPDEYDSTLAKCESEITEVIAVTPVSGKENPCSIYYASGKIFIAQDAVDRFPNISLFVDSLRQKDGFAIDEIKVLNIESTEVKDIIKLLEDEYILRSDGGRYLWCYDISLPPGIITIKDDFV